jgi:predicted  nucleic acid-binding Zn ribbon protein
MWDEERLDGADAESEATELDAEMEASEEAVAESMEIRGKGPFAQVGNEVYGPGLTQPSVYCCPVCETDVLAKHVIWDRNDVAHCPTCRTVLLRKETQA